MKQFK
jgi:hypothetical protein